MVFRYPPEPDVKYVKRLIGLPGERIAVRDGKVYINGQALTELYVLEVPRGVLPQSDMRERLVAEEEFFALGDNRNSSNDSRFWGALPRHNLIGSVAPYSKAATDLGEQKHRSQPAIPAHCCSGESAS